MLAEFQRVRYQNSQKMRDSYDVYESEMSAIGDTADFEKRYGADLSTSIDHSLMRHLQISKPSNLNYDIKEMEEQDYNDAFAEIEAKINEKTRNKLFMVDDVEKRQLSFADKENLREKLFSFLEESNADERKLENEIQRLKEAGDRKAIEVGDALLKLQLRNIERLKDHFKEYQPAPFTKAWGGDPEYAELSKRLKKVLLSEQGNIFGQKTHTKKGLH
jgi:hypothetical protein